MAAKHGERIASALKSLSSDGLVLPVEDWQNFEALIEEFFDNSDDDTGSEDEQVHFVGVFNANPVLSLHRIPGRITKCTRQLTLKIVKM